jgi:sulfane dehydrogenase subunit SoxC
LRRIVRRISERLAEQIRESQRGGGEGAQGKEDEVLLPRRLPGMPTADAGADTAPEGGLLKPVPEEWFVDHRPLLRRRADDATADLALNAETRWEAMSGEVYLTPTEKFFVRNHAPTPLVEASSWGLRVEGPGVERPFTLSYAELLRMPSVTETRVLDCAGNGRKFFDEVQGRPAKGTNWRLGAVGCAEWTGVPLAEVLDRAGITPDASEVMVESLDAARMRRPLPLEKAIGADTLLAYAMNGAFLTEDHGYPARLVVPGYAAVASVKWVGRIYVSVSAEGALKSPWNTDKYVLTGGSWGRERRSVSEQVPKSALELPWPARLSAGEHLITGRAWSPGSAIERVEVSVDQGVSWFEAPVSGPNVAGAWARFSFSWRPRPSRHEIRVRAVDEVGRAQPEESPYNALGYLYGAVVAHPVEVR